MLPSGDKGLYPYQANISQSEKNTASHVTDLGSIILMWELLILLLRQNGVSIFIVFKYTLCFVDFFNNIILFY